MKKITFCLIVATLILCACKHDPIDNRLPCAVTDVDGHVYHAVRIGKQVWMAENLYATMYQDHGFIHNGEMDISDGLGFFRMRPNGSLANVHPYGLLYSWDAATRDEAWTSDKHPVQGACPKGWHVPSLNEWDELINTVNNTPEYQQRSSSTVKALAATNYSEDFWLENGMPGTPGCDPNSNNSTNFSALPAGYYENKHYYRFGEEAYFWTCNKTHGPDGEDEYYYVTLKCDADTLSYQTHVQKTYPQGVAYSVRCVKD